MSNEEEVKPKKKIKTKKVKDKQYKRRMRLLKIAILIIILFLINLYVVLALMYRGENFTITLDSENGRESGLIIYEEKENKIAREYLKSDSIDYFTDISVDWIPKNIYELGEGSHNGKNYIAYTFYAENNGQDVINYWTRIVIDDVIKDVDEAIRVMVYKNGERTIYAKPNKATGNPEKGTVPFYSVEDNLIMLEKTEAFEVDMVDKYTVVIWVEGDDPDCTDLLIGGEIKMHMTLTEEHRSNVDEKTN